MKHGNFVMDCCNSEYAPRSTCGKLYKDRLKLVVSSKTYLNQIIKNSKHLDEEQILELKVPFIQIMGFRAVLSIVKLIDKKLYVVEDLMRFSFPTTRQQTRQGAITEIIKAFSLMKGLLNDLTELIEEGKEDHHHNKMAAITEEAKIKVVSNQHWISDAVFCKDSDNESNEKDDDDEEDSKLFFLIN